MIAIGYPKRKPVLCLCVINLCWMEWMSYLYKMEYDLILLGFVVKLPICTLQ